MRLVARAIRMLAQLVGLLVRVRAHERAGHAVESYLRRANLRRAGAHS